MTGDDRYTPHPYVPRRIDERTYVLDHTRLLPRDEAYEITHRVNGRLHDQRLRGAIRDAVRQLGMSEFVLWVANPLMSKHIGRLGEAVSVFDAIDDWSQHPQRRWMHKSVAEGYARAQSEADLIFTVSEALEERLSKGRGGVYWQPNGVDAERFAGAHDCPLDLASLPRPLVGYVGCLQQRIDVPLIEQLAGAMPEASIVLIGPVMTPRYFEPLAGLGNVHLMGSRGPDLVPSYIGAFDVCIVPHIDNAFTRSMDPLKVYEYLAAGKPIVAQGVAYMGEPAGLVVRATSAAEFVSAVRDSAYERDSRTEERVAFAQSRSWRRRLEEMASIIAEHVEEVPGSAA